MVDMKAKAVISAEDRTAGVFERIAKRMGMMSNAAAKANYMAARTTSASLTQITARSRAMDRVERSTSARAAFVGAAIRTAAPIVGGAALGQSVKDFAAMDRRITRVGITADASADDLKGLNEELFRLGQSVAMPTGEIVTGLETLTAQGRSLKDSMAFLPSVAKTAAATGSAVDDIAKSADAVGNNFKIAAPQMQQAFDVMAAGGKAGTFELKEMARYLPSLGPAAAAAGFKGVQGLTDLVAMLQVVRKGTGTSEEAAGSMANIFQKLESEETQKRFKKFGVDLATGMAKARKEGKNLVEALEEMTATATKGDLSKIPQLFNDMEFGRGMRAIMSARGEWQKLAGAISQTAAGSVDRDLKRVTTDMEARLDKMVEILKHRARQIGGVLADVITPIDDKIKEISEGKNPIANAINDRAQLVNADIIAREELKTGAKSGYDAETRRFVDARKEKLQRDMIDAERSRLDDAIAGTEKTLAGRPVRNARIKAEQDQVRLKAERADFDRVVGGLDETLLKQAEAGAQIDRLKTLGLLNAPYGTSVTTPATKAFGIKGPVGADPSWMPQQPISHRLPPSRPDSLPKAPVTSDDLKGLFPNMPDWSQLQAKIVDPVTAELNGSIVAAITVRVDGPGTVTGMSATSSTPLVRPSVGTSMPQTSSRAIV